MKCQDVYISWKECIFTRGSFINNRIHSHLLVINSKISTQIRWPNIWGNIKIRWTEAGCFDLNLNLTLVNGCQKITLSCRFIHDCSTFYVINETRNWFRAGCWRSRRCGSIWMLAFHAVILSVLGSLMEVWHGFAVTTLKRQRVWWKTL